MPQFVARALDGSAGFGLDDEFDSTGLVVGPDTVDGVERTKFLLDALFTTATRHPDDLNRLSEHICRFGNAVNNRGCLVRPRVQSDSR